MLPQISIWPLVLLFICYFGYHIWRKVFSLQGLPQSIPWLGNGNGVFARGRTTLRSFFGMRELIQEGYEKVCSCLFSTLLAKCSLLGSIRSTNRCLFFPM